MKKTISAFLLIFTIYQNSYSQYPTVNQMVKNGCFEITTGSITGPAQLNKVNFWENVSYYYDIMPGAELDPTTGFITGTPDLLSTYNSDFQYSVPNSRYYTSLNDIYNGNNYVYMRNVRMNATPILLPSDAWLLTNFTEIIQGELTESLEAGCYDFSLYAANPGNIGSGTITPTRINVYLTNGTNGSNKLIYSTGSTGFTHSDFQLKSGNFQISSLEANLYNHVKIEMPDNLVIGELQDVVLDAVSIVKKNVSITASQTSICVGQSVTLTASGSNSYLWGAGLGTNQTITVSPTTTTTYTVTGTSTSGCTTTKSITITVNPLPTVNLGNDVTLCDGDNYPVNLSSPTTIGSPYKYRWTYNGSPVYTGHIGTFGTTAQVNVVGTFCLTVTNLSTTCVKTDCAEVQYDSRMQCTAEFDASTSCNSSNNVMAVVATFPQMCDGMSFYWKVCELDANNQEIFGTCLENPSTWWTTGTTQNFPGYSFVKGHKYRIYRGVWSVPDACIPWRGIYHDVECNATNKEVVINSGTFDKPFSISNNISIENKIKIYPNPTTGNFTANVEKFATGDLIQVLDYSGKVILEKNINTNRIEMNIAEMANGLYFVKVISADGISMEKLIKN